MGRRVVPRAALFLHEQPCPLVFVENNHNPTSNLSPASFIHGSLAAWQSQHVFASWRGGEGLRDWRLDVKGQVRPLALALALSPADEAAVSSELAFEALPPTLQAHTLPLTSLTPSSHISLLPSPRSRQSSLPPEGLLTHHLLLPQFSLDCGKARYFLSLGAQLKRRHLREVLPGHSPLLALTPSHQQPKAETLPTQEPREKSLPGIPAQGLTLVLIGPAWARGPEDQDRGERSPQVKAGRHFPPEGTVGGGQGKSQVSTLAPALLQKNKWLSVEIMGLEPGAQAHLCHLFPHPGKPHRLVIRNRWDDAWEGTLETIIIFRRDGGREEEEELKEGWGPLRRVLRLGGIESELRASGKNS